MTFSLPWTLCLLKLPIEDIKGTATAVHSPVVKGCIMMKSRSEILYNNEDIKRDYQRGPQSRSEKVW